MNYDNRLKIGYLLIAVLIALSGILGIYGTQIIVNLLKGDDEHLRARILNISSLSMNTKNAETDITMCLLLGDDRLRNDYFDRLAEVRNSIDYLKTNVEVESTRGLHILNHIEKEFELFVDAGQAVLDSFDADIKTNGTHSLSDHSDQTKAFFGSASEIRRLALKLAEHETNFLNRQAPITASLELASYSKRLQGHFLAYLLTMDKKDRAKVFDRYQSCWEMVSILEDRLDEPEPRKLLLNISLNLRNLMTYAQEALEIRNAEGSDVIPFKNEDQDSLIRNISNTTEKIVSDAIRIAEINVAMEIGPKQTAIKSAHKVQMIILVVTIIPLALAFVLGYAAHRKAMEVEESQTKLSELNNKLIVVNHNLENEIIERNDAEEDKSRLIIDLQRALAQVKTLSGLIPICSSCKKIRDDRGFWQQVEVYVRDHSEAEFSHSICPDCLRSLYPEMADEILGRLQKKNTES